MYAYLSGTVSEIGDGIAVIDVGGVGYELNIPATLALSLNIGDKVKLPTYLSVREDEMSLFAFGDKKEKTVFLRLISISGIGPKLALSIIGGMSIDNLVSAIISKNTSAINGIKGVGKKTAERIVMELGEKLDDLGINASPLRTEKALDDKASEAVAVLVALGYKQDDATNAVRSAYSDSLTVNQIVHKAISG